jgi:hypothetical protein
MECCPWRVVFVPKRPCPCQGSRRHLEGPRCYQVPQYERKMIQREAGDSTVIPVDIKKINQVQIITNQTIKTFFFTNQIKLKPILVLVRIRRRNSVRCRSGRRFQSLAVECQEDPGPEVDHQKSGEAHQTSAEALSFQKEILLNYYEMLEFRKHSRIKIVKIFHFTRFRLLFPIINSLSLHTHIIIHKFANKQTPKNNMLLVGTTQAATQAMRYD